MSKSAIGALLLGMVTVTGFASFAQAASWDCPMPITKGGCPVLVYQYQPDQQPATP